MDSIGPQAPSSASLGIGIETSADSTPSQPGPPFRSGKRKGSEPQSKEVAQQSKRGRWDEDVEIISSNLSGASSGPAVISGAKTAQINGGKFAVAGRDIITIHNHQHGPVVINILEFLKSFDLPNFRAIQLDMYPQATEGTCLWLTEGYVLLIWIENGKILWGTGDPGAGKTVLASIVINHLERIERTHRGAVCVAYVYIRYSEPLSVQAILQSLVQQILERHADVAPLVESLYIRHQHERTKPSQQELVALISDFTRHGKTIFIVLDALDELSPDERRVLVELLSSTEVKLFITSRPLKALEGHFPDAQFFEITAHPPDVALLAKASICGNSELQDLLGHGELLEHVISAIQHAASGMFLHARLQLDALQACSNALDGESTLQSFPTTLDSVYKHTWDRIVHRDSATLVFLWLIYAKRDLTIEELRKCVAVLPTTNEYDVRPVVSEVFLLSACCGLVTVDKKSRQVRLTHYTVRDAIQPLVSQAYPQPHTTLASMCVSHLKATLVQNVLHGSCAVERALTIEALFRYAYHTWDFHAHQALCLGSMVPAVSEFVLNCANYKLKIPGSPSIYLGPLHMAAHFGFDTLILQAARLTASATKSARCSDSPLQLACRSGHTACVQALLAFPGNLGDLHGIKETSSSALQRASARGYSGIVKLLLDSPGIGVNHTDSGGWTPLMFACNGGFVDVVKLLLQVPGINVNANSSSEGSQGWTALMLAARNGHTQAVEALLGAPDIDVGAKSRSKGSIDCTALMLAVHAGYTDVIQALDKTCTRDAAGHHPPLPI
ncbi:hypothetical protein BKA70DRAFT_1105281 [Coprinopsis sp. MPI-PUGE-AT-0042]|nr:hypothetical protein BKA70DRAFT_1105281 [Coprinopsis sp. MPI-PUGE-AT-0042]